MRARCVLLALALTCACSREPLAPLSIGINAWPGYEFLYLAEQKGFFDAERVPVRIVQYNSLSDVLAGFERGHLDGLGCTVVELLMARSRSRDAQAFYVPDYSNGADVVLARPELTELASLRGKRVGAELGSLGVYMLSRALSKAGLSLDDVELVSSDQLSMEAKFSNGELDAIVTYPPFATRLRSQASGHPLFSSAEIAGEVVDVVVANRAALEQRPADFAALVRGFQRAVEFAEANPAEAFAIMGRREGISAEEFGRALSDGIRIVPLRDQLSFLGDEGTLDAVLRRVGQVLRETRQIGGEDRSAGGIAAGPVRAAIGADAPAVR